MRNGNVSPSTQANNHNYYGTVVSGSSSKGYNVRFDALPHEENIVESFSRQKLTVVLAGEEEKDYDRPLNSTLRQQQLPAIKHCSLNQLTTSVRCQKWI